MDTLFIFLQSLDGASIAKAVIAIGAGIVVIAAAFGIGKIGESALKSIARQPEASGDIRSNMIVSAALIEGVAFFALILLIVALFV
jgi:F-type H+-transporting ATPase subunit c